MPIVGFSSSEQSSGGLFTFAEGRGRVINSVFVNHAIPGYETDCKWRLTIQRIGADGKPTSDDPVDELLGFGKVEHFHPGKADSPTDNDPNLEFGGTKDMGYAEGAEGNCLLGNKNPDQQCKAAIFTRSAEEQGIKKDVFNGRWAGSIIGLEAHFSRFMMKKPDNSTAKTDPTCLIIGKGGQVVSASVEKLVYKYPDGTGVAQIDAVAGGGSTGRATPLRPTPAGPTNVTPISQPVNGAPAPETAQPSQPAQPVAADLTDEAVKELASEIVGKIGIALAGQTAPRKRFETRSLVEMNGMSPKIPAPVQQRVKTFIKNDAWFTETAADYGWVVTQTGEVQIPAAG